jgi:hypothetical protein
MMHGQQNIILSAFVFLFWPDVFPIIPFLINTTVQWHVRSGGAGPRIYKLTGQNHVPAASTTEKDFTVSIG